MRVYRTAGFLAFVMLWTLALTTRPAWAADPPGYGVVGGLAINNASVDSPVTPAIDVTTQTGITIGAFGLFPLSSWFSIMPEVFYSQKGVGQQGIGGTLGNYTANLNYDALEITALGRLDLAPMKPMTYYIVGGAGFPITTRATLTDRDFGPLGTLPDRDFLENSQFATVDVTLIAGFGFGKGPWSAEIRYEHGLQNLNLGDLFLIPSPIPEVKSRAYSFLGRWNFGRR